MVDGAVTCQGIWDNDICGLYPEVASIATLSAGTPDVRWYIDPAQTSDNAHFIARSVISFPNGQIHEDIYLEVQLRNQSYEDAGLVRYLSWHEGGHAIAYLLSTGGAYQDIYDVYTRWMLVRGKTPPPVMNGAWAELTQEQFADDFWASHDPSYSPTNGSQPAAGPLLNASTMKTFFANLIGGYYAMKSKVIQVTTDNQGGWAGWVALPSNDPNVAVIAQRDGISGSEAYLPTFATKVDAANSRVFVEMRGDSQHGQTAYIRLIVQKIAAW